jgi:hypothetical protein
MPLARYFLYVGGVLLALLFIADSSLPKLPTAERADSHLPTIRIHSDQKWPERVVYDTSIPTIIPAESANALANIPTAETVTEMPAKAREVFAQLQRSDANKREPKLQRKRKIARRHPTSPMRLVARQPQFGWFGMGFW